MAEAPQFQILVRLLDGRTRCLRFPAPTVSGAALLDAVPSISRVPAASLRLVKGHVAVSPSSILAASGLDGQFPSASAEARAGTARSSAGPPPRPARRRPATSTPAATSTAGASATSTPSARLEEWKAEAADRQLEKLAEDFIKKKAKEAGHKYLEKYRKDAEICVNVVEESVRASLGKRKGTAPKPPTGADAKKIKIWLGKKKVEDDESVVAVMWRMWIWILRRAQIHNS